MDGKTLPSIWPTGVYKCLIKFSIENITVIQIEIIGAVTNNLLTYW